MIIETNVLVAFDNGLSGTFSIDSDFEQVSFIPHIEDGEWCVSVESFMDTPVIETLTLFNEALKTNLEFADVGDVFSVLCTILDKK